MSRTIEFDMKAYTNSLINFVSGGDLASPNLISPPCNTPEYEAKVEQEVKRLLESPIELLDADIEHVLDIYKKHSCDMCDLGEVLHRYMVGLAEEQANETVSYEYE